MRKVVASALLSLLILSTLPIAWAWEIERPSRSISINERTGISYTNGEVSIGLAVAIHQYDENSDYKNTPDVMQMNISVAANSRASGLGAHHPCRSDA